MATALSSGVAITEAVNPFSWKWYSLPLVELVNGTEALYNAMVTVDSESLVSEAGEDVWAKFDVILLNGTVLPGNAQTGDPGPVTSGNPLCWINEECPGGYVMTYSERPRVTASFGFNYTAPGGSMPPLMQLIVGVRESGGAGGAISFTISATQLPRMVYGDATIHSAVAPCSDDDEAACRQYFTVPVYAYDVLHVRLERAGDNLTYTSLDGSLHSNGGRGLVGTFYVGAPSAYNLPPPIAADVVRPIDNLTASVEAEYFCTLAPQAGLYTLAIIGGHAAAGGFGAELLTSEAELAIGAGIPRQGRGRYILHVRHAVFEDGALPSSGTRPGCVSFGQVRNYTVTTSGMGDANLYAEVSGGNVSSMRARCPGCEWVEATPPINALSASPCLARNGTTWELQLSLADSVTATLAGLEPTEFSLSTRLQNATLAPGELVTPRADGGRGYVCCGGVQNYIVPNVPETHAVAVELNLTRGHVRAAFAKHGACADPNADVDGALCTGLCEMAWFTVYDEFYGSMEFTQSHLLSIPFGPQAWSYNPETTKRREGDWYISIQALPGHAAEYRLAVTLLDPPRAPDVFSCSRFTGFCPRSFYHTGLSTGDGVAVELSSTSAASSVRHAPFMLCGRQLPLLCTLLSVLMLGVRHRQRRPGLSSCA